MPTFHRPRLAIIEERGLPVAAAVPVLAAVLAAAILIHYALVILLGVLGAEALTVAVLAVAFLRQRPFRLVWRPERQGAQGKAIIAQAIQIHHQRAIEAPGATQRALETGAPRELHQHIHLHGLSAGDVAAIVTAQRQGTLSWPGTREN